MRGDHTRIDQTDADGGQEPHTLRFVPKLTTERPPCLADVLKRNRGEERDGVGHKRCHACAMQKRIKPDVNHRDQKADNAEAEYPGDILAHDAFAAFGVVSSPVASSVSSAVM